MSKAKKAVSFFLRIAVSAVLLLLVLRSVDLQVLGRTVAAAHFGYLAAAFCLFLVINFFCFIRWKILLAAGGVVLPAGRILSAYCGGISCSLFMPSAIGGDLVRLTDLSLQTKKAAAVVATGIIDRLAGFFGMVIVALSAALIGYRLIKESIVFLILALLAFVLAVLVAAIFYPPLYSRINSALCRRWQTGFCSLFSSVHKQMFDLNRHPRALGKSLGLSLCIQTMSVFSMYLIAVSLGARQPAEGFFILLPVVSALTLLPVSIAGLGVRDVSAVFFLAKIGVARDTALGVSLITFFFLAVIAAVAGVAYVFTLHHRRV